VPYREILAVQSACLAAGMPALFLTADPDGMRVGPTAVPGVGPCFACAQLAAIRFTRLDSEAALAVISGAAGISGDPVGTETRRIPLERDPTCPLCSGVSAPPSTAVAARTEITILKNEEQCPPRAISSAATGERIRSVGILGGGTAGYLTALALRRKAPDLAVTLIESPDLPILGVNEATTPLMPQFLHVDLGLDVH